MIKTYDPLASVQAAGPPGSISFMYGLPDPATFPTTDLQICFDTVFRKNASLALQYGPEQGYGPLIDYLREKTQKSEAIFLERPQIMLTGGASQALDHICTLFTRPGDSVLVEAPTYHESIKLFLNHGLHPLQVPIDEDGLNVEELSIRLKTLRDQGKKARLLYTIPNFQNPSGITLSAERRKAILDLAEESDLLVVEDDVYYDLAYEDLEIPSLFSLDKGQRILRLGSFSKIISPGLRIGWMMGPKDFIQYLIRSGLCCMGGGANPLIANAVSIYCKRGFLEPHIKSIRSIYRKRRDIMLETLKSLMPDGIHWTKPHGGFFVWLTLPRPLCATEAVKGAKSEGILLLGGDPFFAESVTGQHLRVAFSYLHTKKIQEGIEKLAWILKSHL